jgi:hypothetical protein
MHLRIIVALWAMCLAAAADQPAPFGADVTVAQTAVAPGPAINLPIDCLSPARAGLWTTEDPRPGSVTPPFAIAAEDGVDTLRLSSDGCVPGRTTVRVLLPGDGPANGAVWGKAKATHLVLECSSSEPVGMTMHLLVRGKTVGSHQTGFSIPGGGWNRVLLPLADFDLTSWNAVAGLGFRWATATPGAEIRIRSLAVCSLPWTDASWSSRLVRIGLAGDWRFAPDPQAVGVQKHWSAPDHDDAAWQVLTSERSWQEQGVELAGWGWYRQRLVIPAACAGMPLRLTFCKLRSDDEVWFNGERIGGFSGEYTYDNWLTRTYTVPSRLIRYGGSNSIALRIWGGNLSFIGDKSGLTKGPMQAELDPYAVLLRDPGGEAMPADLYDLSDAQHGRPFAVVVPLPAEIAVGGGSLTYAMTGMSGEPIVAGRTDLAAAGPGVVQAQFTVAGAAAEAAYLAGRLRLILRVDDTAGAMLYAGKRELQTLRFARRDALTLPALPETWEETTYGRLRLVDVIDTATATGRDEHPYVQSGFNREQNRMTPGSPVDVQVHEILGRQARESSYGWFAYRIGRGGLKPHGTYLLRIEYPEDKPRFAPIEIQIGQNYSDVGWKNGVGANDPYDNWPLSGTWRSFDVVVPLDDETMGSGGTGSARAEHGFWVYFINKVRHDGAYAMYEGGPAVGRIRLYELDPVADAPRIHLPQGLPQRILAMDWERQPDSEPADMVRYARLMGYNAISPVILKWHFQNFAEPLDGYDTVGVDAQGYWTRRRYDATQGIHAIPAVPGVPSPHQRYLQATHGSGVAYIPRIEWGGSLDLPTDARAIDATGKPAKPVRFAEWCGNILAPAAWDDLKRYVDMLIGGHASENPQLLGVHWRSRCDRTPISYGPRDLELFAAETGTALPSGNHAQRVAWASGAGRAQYDTWWHRKRAAFHIRLSELLRSYRPDLRLWYFNWDMDKFGLIDPDITSWAFLSTVFKTGPTGGRAAYELDRRRRAGYTAADYIEVLRSGNLGNAFKGLNRADLGLRPELYREAPGIELFAPANYRCYADKPAYLNYFRTAEGVAVSNVVSYDEVGARSINPKYEGNMISPAGPACSMALELLAWFHSDARTLNYTAYTYGRGFADAHRRFAQAYLALPALPGHVVDQPSATLRIRRYDTVQGIYVGVANAGFADATVSVPLPGTWTSAPTVSDLVGDTIVPSHFDAGVLHFDAPVGAMRLNAYLVR